MYKKKPIPSDEMAFKRGFTLGRAIGQASMIVPPTSRLSEAAVKIVDECFRAILKAQYQPEPSDLEHDYILDELNRIQRILDREGNKRSK